MSDQTTAERVEAAALRLFAARGFEGTGIRQIALESGISVASLYHYMGTKEDLLERMMRESMRRLLDPAGALVVSTDPVARVAGLVDLHVRQHAQESLLCIVADTEIRSLSPERRREMVSMRDAYEALWEETVSYGVSTGAFQVPDEKMAAFALLEMCTGVAYWYSPKGRMSLDEICEAFVGMALSLLSGNNPYRSAAGHHFISSQDESAQTSP